MGNEENNTTLYELLKPTEVTLFRVLPPNEFILKTVKWSIEQCIAANITNNSRSELLKNIYVVNGVNVTCLEHSPVLTQSRTIRAGVLSVIAVLAFFGNIATIISIKINKRCRGRARPSWTAIYSLIFQLSVADLLVTIFCIAGEAAWSFTVQWYAGNVACKVFKFLQMFALYLSTFVLVLIGLDRWLAVRYPMKSMGTAARSGKLVSLAWALSFILSIPQAIVFRVAPGPFVEEFHQCVTYGFYTERWQEQMYTMITFIFMFLLPLAILVSTYVATIHTIAQSEKVFKTQFKEGGEKYVAPDMNRRRLIDRAKMKSLRMSVVIVFAFIIWWTPYYIMMIIFTFLNPDKDQSEDLREWIFFFGMTNSLVNPIIYGAFHLWPTKRTRYRDRESNGQHASLLRRDQMSSVRLTTVRSIRSSAKYTNGNNISPI